MSLEAIGAIAALDPVAAAPAALPATNAVGPAGFGPLFSHGLDALNTQLNASQADLQGVALGDSQNLHQVMIRLEETRLTFQLAVQVRNRLLEAYQDVMRMQV